MASRATPRRSNKRLPESPVSLASKPLSPTLPSHRVPGGYISEHSRGGLAVYSHCVAAQFVERPSEPARKGGRRWAELRPSLFVEQGTTALGHGHTTSTVPSEPQEEPWPGVAHNSSEKEENHRMQLGKTLPHCSPA